MEGGKGDSCSTNLNTDVGSDFATGESWKDIIGLWAKIRNIRQGEAAKELALALADVQAFNGFGNRFLWICARRPKLVSLAFPYGLWRNSLHCNKSCGGLFPMPSNAAL